MIRRLVLAGLLAAPLGLAVPASACAPDDQHSGCKQCHDTNRAVRPVLGGDLFRCPY